MPHTQSFGTRNFSYSSASGVPSVGMCGGTACALPANGGGRSPPRRPYPGRRPTPAAEAAGGATEDAIAQLEGHKPGAALFFDCVATRLRVGKGFGNELSAVAEKLGQVPLVGCNTYGQVAQVEGQFSGFHNCTAIICVIPE